MNISLNPAIASQLDQFKIGLIHYKKIVVEQSPQMIKGRMQLFQESLYFELQEQPVTERTSIAEWRSIWKALGADPNRYRHSAESLLRRIGKQNYITPFHSAVDLNNFFSLRFEIPIGIYDVSKLEGDIEISVGDAETGYEGLNGRYNTLQNILYSRDAQGAFGSPYVDSSRTVVTENTTEALQIFYLRPSLSVEESLKLLKSSAEMFTQVSGGSFKTAILTFEQPSIQF